MKNLGIFLQLELDATDAEVERGWKKVFAKAKETEHFFRAHDVDCRCKGYVFKGEDNPKPPNFARNDINKYIVENPDLFADFLPEYFQVWTYLNIRAMAVVGGKRSCVGSRSTYKANVHEFGHNLGLRHSSKKLKNGDIIEYGNAWCFMGTGNAIQGMSGMELVRLNAEEPREIKRLIYGMDQKVHEVSLCPVELPSYHPMEPDEYQIVRIHNFTPWYNVHLRKARGCYWPVTQALSATLWVQERHPDGRSMQLDPNMVVGETRFLPSSLEQVPPVKVEYLAYDPEWERARIRVTYE